MRVAVAVAFAFLDLDRTINACFDEKGRVGRTDRQIDRQKEVGVRLLSTFGFGYLESESDIFRVGWDPRLEFISEACTCACVASQCS